LIGHGELDPVIVRRTSQALLDRLVGIKCHAWLMDPFRQPVVPVYWGLEENVSCWKGALG